MGSRVRRVVTGTRDGRSTVLHDASVGAAVEDGPFGLFDVWCTGPDPAADDGSDPVADGEELRVEPPPGGTLFRIVHWAPGQEAPRHRTDTLDYLIVLSGRVTLSLDDGDVTLGPGDCLVQRGVQHGWRNDADEPCVVGVVEVSTKSA